MEKNMKRKRKKRRIFVSTLSSILVMLTAVTPALTYAENSNEITESESEFLYINIKNSGGAIIVNENSDSIKTFKIENSSGKDMIDVYDSSGQLIDSCDATSNSYTYANEISKDSQITIHAKADSGNHILSYEVYDMQLEQTEITSFESPQTDFAYSTVMDGNKKIITEFEIDASESKDNESDDSDIRINTDNNEGVLKDAKNDLTISSDIQNNDSSDANDLTVGDTKEADINSTEKLADDLSINDAVTTSYTGDEDKTSIKEMTANDSDQCYILAYEVNKIIDGTAPFDTDNTPGNDDSDENRIVRSFDSINYTLKYTTAIRDSEISGINESYVEVRFELPLSEKEASFDESTMNWCLNRKITYVYDDGTSSETLDKNKTVVNQILTGRRHLVNSDAGNTIPGTGTLSVGIKIKAAANGTKIKPVFSIWMEGNPENDIKTIESEEVTVSAAPKYNLSVISDTGVDYLAYFNKDTGETSTEKKDGMTKGRLVRYALNFQLYNDSASKGLKGIEMPSGNVDFDISLQGTLDGTDIKNMDNYNISVWDYSENESVRYGHWGKTITPSNSSGPAYYGPYNKNKNRVDYSCYNGGAISMSQDESDETLYHISFSDYEIDYEKMFFPKRYRWSNAGNVNYQDNVGCISAGQMLVLSTFPDTVDTQKTLYQDVQIKNPVLTSISGQPGTEMITNDNRVRKGITLYPAGWISKYQRYCNSKGAFLSTVYYSGDNIATIGDKIQIESFIHGKAEFHWSDFNLLQKFDDEAIEVDDGKFRYSQNYCTQKGTVKLLFGAKPDKTGWIDDKEMGATYEENLVFFENIDDLKSAGYTCVALLYEIRGVETQPLTVETSYFDLYANMKVKTDTSIIGKVYQTTSELRAWRQDDKTMQFSWLDVPYNTDEKSYGIGKTDTTYIEGYTKPYTLSYSGNNYQKASYKDGVMYGHNGYNLGNSLLIIGNITKISIKNADKTGDMDKTVYDLDAGERTARFSIQPTTIVASENAEVQESQAKDTLTVTAILPKGLHLNQNGISLEPEQIIENQDGTTTVIWKIEDVKIGATIEPITFSTIIGDEGTVNDVKHNDSFTISAKITSKNDIRTVSAVNGNYSETSISVIKLAASAVTKRVLTPLVELGQNIEYRLRYSNLSDTEAVNAKVYDILPYNNDKRGSEYGGKYKLSSVTIDYANAKRTFDNGKDKAKLFTTISQNGRDKSWMENLMINDTGEDEFTEATNNISVDEDKKTVTWNNIDIFEPSAFYAYIGYVFGNEYIDIYVTITPYDADTKQQPGNIYANNFTQYADNQASIVTSNVVRAQVVKRSLSGLVWIDKDNDGIRSDKEILFKNAVVRLFSTDKTVYNNDSDKLIIDGKALYPAYDIFGTQISEVKTDENGKYYFDNLPAGNYYIIISDIEKYRITLTDEGTDDTLDSDAIDFDNIVHIPDITLPEIVNMTDWSYESPNHDTGLVLKTKLTIKKVSAIDKTGLDGAKLAIYDYDDAERSNPIITFVSEKEKSKEITDILLAGHKYILKELSAPDGYEIADEISFTIDEANPNTDIIMQDNHISYDVNIQKQNMKGALISGAILHVTGKEMGSSTDISPIEWTSSADKPKSIKLRPGSYILHEVTPPAGYLTTDDISFTVDMDGNVFIGQSKIDIIKMEDKEVKAGTINIKKYDSDSKTALSGVIFKLECLDVKYPELSNDKDYNRLLKKGESREAMSDSNGSIKFENLDQGTYRLTEIKTIEGHQLLAEPIIITLPLEMTDAEVAATSNIDISKADHIDGKYYFYDLTYEISNNATLSLPKTGNNGVKLFIFGGFAVITFFITYTVITKSFTAQTKKKGRKNGKKK